MFLKRISIENFKALKDVDIQFEEEFTPTVFPLGSLNGGGKSTLLQLVFTLLHCSFNKKRHQYLKNLLSTLTPAKSGTATTTLAKFDVRHDDKNFYLEFIVSDNHLEGENFNAFLNVEELAINHDGDLDSMLKEEKNKQSKILDLLKSKEMLYVTHFDNEKKVL